MNHHYTIRAKDNIDKPLRHLLYLALLLAWEMYHKPLYGLILAFVILNILWPVEL